MARPPLEYKVITQRPRISPLELRVWMRQHDTTQREMAERLGVSLKAVNNWCTGRARTPFGLHDELSRLFGKPYPPYDGLLPQNDPYLDDGYEIDYPDAREVKPRPGDPGYDRGRDGDARLCPECKSVMEANSDRCPNFFCPTTDDDPPED